MFRFIVWFIWDFTGLRFIFRKLFPQKYGDTRGRPPSTLLLWLIAVYLVTSAVAYQRYQRRVDVIEYRANAIFEQIASDELRKSAIDRISTVQNMPCPVKPRILAPLSIFRSLFFDRTYPEIVELLKRTVENLKDDLDSANLANAYLAGADLMKADLKRARLNGANLQKAQLNEANLWEAGLDEAALNEASLIRALARKATLRKAILQNANLQAIRLQEADLKDSDLRQADMSGAFLNETVLAGVNLSEANLTDTYFTEADFTGADLSNAIFTGAHLNETNLTEAKLKNAVQLTAEQLCEAKSLYKAELDLEIEAQVKTKCPQLLQKPTE